MNKSGVGTAVVTWLSFLGLYMLFCCKADPLEAAAGGAAALLALKLAGSKLLSQAAFSID